MPPRRVSRCRVRRARSSRGVISLLVFFGVFFFSARPAYADWPLTYGSGTRIISASGGGVRITSSSSEWKRFMTPRVERAGSPYVELTWVGLLPGAIRGSWREGQVEVRCGRTVESLAGASLLPTGDIKRRAGDFTIRMSRVGDVIVQGTIHRGWQGVTLPILLPPAEMGRVSTEVKVSVIDASATPQRGVALALINTGKTNTGGRALWLPLHAPSEDYTAVLPAMRAGSRMQLWFYGMDNVEIRAVVSVMSTTVVQGPRGSGYWLTCVARPVMAGGGVIVSTAFLGYRVGSRQLDRAEFSSGTAWLALSLLVVLGGSGLLVYRRHSIRGR